MKFDTKKRGQISYVMIGIVVLLIIFMILFLTNKPFEKTSKIEQEYSHPVKLFVENCIKDTVKEGIRKISSQAGYLDPYAMDFKFSPNPSSSDGIFLGDTFIPYWYYLGENDIFKSNRPPLCEKGCGYEGYDSIEDNIVLYLDKNIYSCIDDFKSFPQYDIEEGQFSSDVIIRQDDILISANYPLEISSSNNSKISFSDFEVSIKSSLKDAYDLAYQIIKFQSNAGFIETHVLNMLSLYSGIDKNLPPLADLQIGGNDLRFWLKPDVENKVKDDILDLVRLIQVQNTKNFNPIYYMDRSGKNAISQGIYNAMSFTAGEKYYGNLEVSFMYPYLPINLKIGDSQVIFPKNKLPMENFIFDMLGLTIYDYTFYYDMSFPVLITIKADDLTFNFAIESNIRNNLPLTSDMSLDRTESVGTTPLFSSPTQRVNRTITIFVKDAFSKKPLDNASVYYSCGGKLFIGKTKQGKLSDKFPFCMFGGTIIVDKGGYSKKEILFDNHESKMGETFWLELYPLVEKNIEVRKIPEKYISYLASKKYSPDFKKIIYEKSEKLGKYDRAIITISSNETNIPLIGFLSIGDAESNNDYLKEEVERQYEEGEIDIGERDRLLSQLDEIDSNIYAIPEKLDLIPGTYEYEAYLLYEKEISIPREIEEICPCSEILGICICDKEELVYPEQNFTAFPIGGASTNIKIYENIYNKKDTLVFYIFDSGTPASWDDLKNHKLATDYEAYGYMLTPYLKRSGEMA